jgi:hypothetical protein
VDCLGSFSVLQRYLQLETIYSFQESFEGKRSCNDNFCFTEKRIPFCQETMIVSIRLQRFNLEKVPNEIHLKDPVGSFEKRRGISWVPGFQFWPKSETLGLNGAQLQ